MKLHVTFTVTGSSLTEITEETKFRLATLDGDVHWRTEIDITPATVTGDGTIHAWTGEVNAYRETAGAAGPVQSRLPG